MVSNSKLERNRDEGFTLIEMLVATAIFAIAVSVALILYDAAQKSYKAGENFTEQQQSTRVAFDRMLSDLRMAGFNFNPDGDSTRVDEQIEGAWDTAVTFRGDFDFEDPTASANPETALAGANYEVVSTGNDEIITYALAKSGATGPDALAVRVDPDRPRSAAVKNVLIPNVSLVHDDPPYTLYRIGLANLGGIFPASPQASSNFVYEPVADNVRSMSLRYYDDSGLEIGPNTPADDTDDLGGADSASFNRSRIRKITVSLVGMTEDQDLRYTDVSDAVASNYRKFALESDVYAENLGRAGIKDLDVTPPARPTNVTLVPDHCDGILVKWDPPSSSEAVTSYVVKYWPNGSPGSATTQSFGYPHVEFGTVDFDAHAFVEFPHPSLGGDFCFAVSAKDSAGNQSGWGPPTAEPCETINENSTPSTPQTLVASGNGSIATEDSQVTVSWDEVQNNTGVVTGDPDQIAGNTIFRDAKGYKLYRGTMNPFTLNDNPLPSPGTLVADASALGFGDAEFVDTDAANCADYYYVLKASDTCDTLSAESNVAYGRAETTIPPEKPTALTGATTGPFSVDLDWTAVTTKVDGSGTTIDLYKIYRAKELSGTPTSSISSSAYLFRGSSSTDAYTDTLDSQDHTDLNQGYSLYYVVSAADLCGNESAKSDTVEVFCSFNGTLTTNPADGDSNGGIVPIDFDVSGPDNYVRARVRIEEVANPGTFVYDQEIFTYPFSFPAWDSNAVPAGVYSIVWEVENQKGCSKTVTTTFTVTANLACQITPTNPNLSPTTGLPSSLNKVMTWDIINNSGKDLDIFQIDISWTSILTGTRQLVSIQYPAGAPTLPTLITGPMSPVQADFTLFPLLLPLSADGLCGGPACIMTMALEWDFQIVDSGNVGEIVSVTYHFQDPSTATGTCSFDIKPDLTI